MISLSRQVAILRGCAHGIGQPTVSGWAWVAPGGAPDWAAVDAAMRAAVVAATGVGEVSFAAPDDPPHADMMPALRALRWAGALQRAAGLAVFEEGVVFAREPGDGETRLGFALPWYGHPDTAVASLGWAAQSLHDLLVAQGDEAREAAARKAGEAAQRSVQDLRRFALKDMNTRHFLRAAHEAGIPWRHVVANIHEMGHGARSRWLDSTITDRTCALGTRLAHNKGMAAQVLRAAGLPVPAHALAASSAQAEEIAQRLGYPVVVKPMDKEGGTGVAAGLQSGEAVHRAWIAAREHSEHVLVEKHIEGRDYRLVVLHGRLIRAVTRLPGGVTGDGRQTVAQLLAVLNADPRRGSLPSSRLRIVDCDDEAMEMLDEAGLTLDSVPDAGRFVPLRRRANVASGGMPVSVLEEVHPDNARLAVRAARALRLDIAGVDLLMPDISRSWQESGGGICEVNAQPQVGGADTPGVILAQLLPHGGRIPLVLVVGDEKGADETALALERLWVTNGLRVGRVSTGGAWIGDEHILPPGSDFFEAGQAVLANTEVQAAVLAGGAEDLAVHGLPFDRCHVVVLAGAAAGDASAQAGHAERLVDVYRMAALHSMNAVVVNAEDPLCATQAEAAGGGTPVRAGSDPQELAGAAYRALRQGETSGSPVDPE